MSYLCLASFFLNQSNDVTRTILNGKVVHDMRLYVIYVAVI
jgi:hypothetical protein